MTLFSLLHSDQVNHVNRFIVYSHVATVTTDLRLHQDKMRFATRDRTTRGSLYKKGFRYM